MLVGASHRLGESTFAMRVGRVTIDKVDTHDPVSQAEGGLHGFRQTLLGRRFDRDPVDDNVDVMLAFLVQGRHLTESMDLTINAHTGETVSRQLPEEFDVLALAATDDRRQHLELRALVQGHQPIDDLLRGLTVDELPTHRAVGLADTGPEQTQVVMDLRDRADRRTWVAGRGLLVDGDGGAETLDEVDVWLVHLSEELAGVGGQGFHVTTLALSKDGVEGKGGLPRS